jgi:hypothetical protein
VTLPDYDYPVQERIQDLKLGGGALKKIAPSGGRRDPYFGLFVAVPHILAYIWHSILLKEGIKT